DSTTSYTSSRTVVERNLFLGCSGELEIISNKSYDNIYRHNTFDSCQGTLTLRVGGGCRVEGNWFFGRKVSSTGGVRIIDRNQTVINNYFEGLRGTDARSALTFMNGIPNTALTGYFQVSNALVAFNTFVDCARNINIGQSGSADGTNSTMG